LNWIPIKSLTLRHIVDNGLELLGLYNKAAAMQAVDSMLSYNPVMMTGSSFSKQRASLFLITTSGSWSMPLDVCAVHLELSSSDLNIFAKAAAAADETATSHIQISSRLDRSICMRSTPTTVVSAVGAAAACSTLSGWKSPQQLAAAAVGANHPVFGLQMEEALLDHLDHLDHLHGTTTKHNCIAAMSATFCCTAAGYFSQAGTYHDLLLLHLTPQLCHLHLI
jgi:hypothetical protein